MIDPKKCHRAIDDLAKKLADAIPSSVKQAKGDMEKTFHSILQGAFAKLDLVTREEFDIQTAVLTKTRAKLERLEEAVTVLEVKAGIKTPSDTDERAND
ncbi:MAG: accessory factor UbiK family protein [Legionellales bacterium]|nr:accessory factor UbiK family protein [Legionellales bacterium]